MQIRTWHLEAFVMAIPLVAVCVISREAHEIVGALAVFVGTRRMSVADRLREAVEASPDPEVSCHRWLLRYLITNEVLWVAYYGLLGAWNGLVGAGLFLLYPAWRRLYRRWYPRDRHKVGTGKLS